MSSHSPAREDAEARRKLEAASALLQAQTRAAIRVYAYRKRITPPEAEYLLLNSSGCVR